MVNSYLGKTGTLNRKKRLMSRSTTTLGFRIGIQTPLRFFDVSSFSGGSVGELVRLWVGTISGLEREETNGLSHRGGTQSGRAGIPLPRPSG